MDHHHHHHNEEEPRSAFTPPSIIRDSSAFSKPILPPSSSLVLTSPKPPNGSIGSGSAAPDPQTTRYRECLRNHAASLGGHVVDGCCEFMPIGPADPMKCAACGCHRSFHRRDLPESGSDKVNRVPLLLPPAPHPNPLRYSGNMSTTDQSSSEERNNSHHQHHSLMGSGGDHEGGRKKRFRTKFSGEQKEKMRAFAERAGWRVQKKDEGEMERFCSEIGVSRQVLKVWMHNNKHLVRRQQEGNGLIVKGERQQEQQQQQQQQQGEMS